MKSYLQMLETIYRHGIKKHPSRIESGETANATFGLPNVHFKHELTNGFPLLTTRKLAWRGVVGELRTFLEGGATNASFEANGCKFWRPWARKDGSLGPIYGKQWNAHGQMAHVLDCLRNRPTDRRMVVSAWRPDEHEQMVLPPCHVLWVVTVYGGRLNLSWIQRSCDFPIGVPYNIASYALLAHILAKWAGLLPGTIDAIFCDAHIYENQLDGVHEQLSRRPGVLPSVRVEFGDRNDFASWSVELSGYKPQENIDFGELEV